MSVPKVTVAAILEKQGNVLLVRRAFEPFIGCWALPGGHIDVFEPAGKAIVREVREETGLRFVPGFFRWYDEILPKFRWHAVVLVFSGKSSGVLKGQSAEILEAGWFSRKEVEKMRLAFRHGLILAEYWGSNRDRGGRGQVRAGRVQARR